MRSLWCLDQLTVSQLVLLLLLLLLRKQGVVAARGEEDLRATAGLLIMSLLLAGKVAFRRWHMMLMLMLY